MAEPDDGPVTVPAPAKINLYLHVTGRRDDGYHELDSLIAFAGIHDVVELTAAADGEPRLDVDGPFADAVPQGPGNLALAAAERLGAGGGPDARGGVRIRLEKRLPVAAGIGGGSADAAAVLKGLARLWGLDADTPDMAALALALGADVPVCLRGQAAFVAGIGEALTPAPALPPAWLVLVNPGVAVSTADVFEASEGDFSLPDRFETAPADAEALAATLKTRRNDLTAGAIRVAPVIADVLGALEAADGGLLARMSGSGATCFQLFDDAGGAARAAARLGQDHPEWWVRAAPLLPDTATLAV